MRKSAPRLYDDLAFLWPLISPPDDYTAEAADVRELLQTLLPTMDRQPAILELGAGGGHTLYHLQNDYEAVAVDLSPAMLEHCRKLNPGVQTVVGDMRNVQLGRTFDAVLIHDAIDYLTTRDDIERTLRNAAAYLNPGGIILVAPTYIRETFQPHEAAMDQRQDEQRVVTYMSYVRDPDPSDDIFDLILVYLIDPIDGNELPRVEQDHHVCGLFGEADWLNMLATAGFDAQLHESDEAAWTLFVGRTPPHRA